MPLHPEVSEIRRKMLNNPWPKYLRALSINKLRGWRSEDVKFQFPVCAIAGENGCGKSTVLKAAAALYQAATPGIQDYSPSDFFLDTAWEISTDVTLKYTFSEGTDIKNVAIRKPSRRWRFPASRPRRNVVWQDISRTLPLDATVGYSRIAKRSAAEMSAVELAANTRAYYSEIMGRRYAEASIRVTNLDSSRPVGVVRVQDSVYSQFHQGAGEDATLDVMLLLQDVPSTSLILIDEVEASLHPRAQRRLVHFLLWLARTKQVQVILSTHSPYVLEELPPEGRIFLQRTPSRVEVLYGATPEFALHRMDDYEHPELRIFVEDQEAKTLAFELARAGGVDLSRIKCDPVGPANVVQIAGRLAQTGALSVNGIGVVDADQEAQFGCAKLPGHQAPERQVFGDICSNASNHLAQALSLTVSDVDTALTIAMTDTDHHGWIARCARRLSVSPQYLWETMARIWVAHCVPQSDIAAFTNSLNVPPGPAP